MRTRQGETICLGEWIRPASADFPPAGGVWGGMRAGFGTDLFSKSPEFRFRFAKYAVKDSELLLLKSICIIIIQHCRIMQQLLKCG